MGFTYHGLVIRSIDDLLFESSLLSVEPAARRRAVSTDGYEFLFMLRGSVDFLLGQETIRLEEGDALFFNGRIPHVPQNQGRVPAQFLAVYLVGHAR